MHVMRLRLHMQHAHARCKMHMRLHMYAHVLGVRRLSSWIDPLVTEEDDAQRRVQQIVECVQVH